MSSPPHSSTRRVPPPCWSQHETLALIQAYRDKWYSVNRANLRAADWDAVAAAVAESSSAHPPKSSLQCRHKIEKLRKRYRAEKQRCLNFPGRFFSSWDLFPLLDAMSIGSAGSKQSQDNEGNEIGEGFRLKTLGDGYLVAPKKFSNVDQDFDPVFDVGLDPDLAFRARKFSRADGESQSNTARGLGNGFCSKPVGDINSVSVAFRPNDCGRFDGKLKPNIDFPFGYEAGVSVKVEKALGDNKSLLPQVAKLRGYGKIVDDSRTNNNNFVEDFGGYAGFPLRSLGDLPPGYKPKYRKTDKNSNPSFVNDLHGRGNKGYRLGESVVDCWGSPPPPPVHRPKSYCKVELDSDVLNGCNVKKNGLKELKDPIKELVSAISMSANTFVKVEKMKMEMAMEIEKMRMDMLLKHNQMILESQQQIVDAFVKAASEHHRKKRKQFEVVSLKGNSEFAAPNCARTCENNIGEE